MNDDLIGKQLGGYEILERVGQGGMATVYRARQTSMDRIVALKILPLHLMKDDTYLQRFEREVRIVAQLEHRNIVPVHDYGESEGQPYIAMRFMDAGSVDDLIRKGPMPAEQILDIVTQIAPALDYAHTKNVLHRDLKPSNILLDDDGGAYITDFGIARILGVEGQGNTITTQGVVGTPSYMSPEQAQGHAMDGRSDIYGLGVMLFEMATGRRPFQNETPYGIAVMQVTTPPPNPRAINPNITAAVEQVILKALKKRPENRHQTAAALADDLADAVKNPENKDDTQPRPLPVKEALDLTQPAPKPPRSFEDQATMPSSAQNAPSQSAPSQSPQQPLQPAAAPPPSRLMPAQNPTNSSQVSRPYSVSRPVMPRRRKRPNNMWVSIAVGGLIGCGLLTTIAIVIVMAAGVLLNNNDDDPAPEPTNAESGISSVPTLDPTSETARLTMVGNAAIPGNNLTTPVFVNATPIPSRTPTPIAPAADATGITPVGMRATATFDPDFNLANSQVIYFAFQENTYNVLLYDLLNGEVAQLTADDTSSSYPAVSPDGSQIVFQSDRDGDFDLYMLDVNSGEIAPLTDNDVLDRLPAWSPDGEWIIYSTDTRGDGTYDLYRIPAAGGNPEPVFSNGQRNSHARYNSDGRQIVFTSGDPDNANTWEIILLDLGSGETLQLTSNDTRDASPTFSPDDSFIIFNAYGDGRASIVRMSPTGGRQRTLYDGPGWEWGMHFSPDGEFILFNEEVEGVPSIYLMRADGSDVRRLDEIIGYYPSWIP